MRMKGKGTAISSLYQHEYRDIYRKGDKPRHWSWRKQKRAKCVSIPVADYLKEQQHGSSTATGTANG